MKISILLSTYNGQTFLEEQLNSLINQNYANFKIYIRDDGSTDNTPSILEKFAGKFPAKIEYIQDNLGNLTVFESYKQLLLKANSDYYLFCDQDDIWLPEKLEILKTEFEKREKEFGDIPILLAHDYSVFGDQGLIEKSAHQKYKLSQKEINNSLFQGFIAGCTCIFNSKAEEIYLKYSKLGIHDKHLINLLNIYGKIVLVKDVLINYRVHSNNAVGLKINQKTKVLVKDLVKYCFRSVQYRKIVLDEYFKMQVEMSKQIDNDLLYEKEYFSEIQLKNLNLIDRKKWFLKHFKPFSSSFFEGLVTTILI
jgi:glycosyltransferase involved in cell wall biosynthesis